MSIKPKLRLGLGLLFVLIVLQSLVASRNVYKLKDETANILADNYNTLEYSRNMMLALDHIDEPRAKVSFETNLQKQFGNITEPGEQQATERVKRHFNLLRAGAHADTLPALLREDILGLIKINMEAIRAKNDVANGTVNSAILWIVLTATACTIIALTLFVNLPGNIANPLMELSDSIKQIAAKNYSRRVRFDRKDEFGQLGQAFNAMAEKLEEYDDSNLARLLIEKKRTEALINNMHEPVIGLDQKGIVLFANQEAIKITGLSMSEMIGRSVQELSERNDLVRTLAGQGKAGEDAVLKDGHTLKIYADEKESYFEKEVIDISIVPTGEKERVCIGKVILLKNVTPFKELDSAKTNFIATVSHELKTPISAIKISLQLLQSPSIGTVNAEQAQLIESIKDDSERLLKITGELLNMSQVETGNIQLNIQTAKPETICEYALEAVRLQAEQKGISLIAHIQPGVPAVRADLEKTAWVLINFLTNAIRYSTEGAEIAILIGLDEHMVNFSVQDTGQGIDLKYREKIFNRYFQVPGSQKSGTGLGLAISKEFIEAQGGSIGLESEVGAGSTFFFKLAEAEVTENA
ncbi:PAS domain S-box-containing protein [Dyadobacter sp. SG02]|uniref:ATP-binding protein n=1 Tax=Dyadobacter sp. SG02 TaxID=1855291 RepID=UPI0008B65B2A|nr:ATP-binding protein [Dyadobacter sp. SG02]SEI52062.1 PAS domain S-box-containing protein [Dyadobacter sp. SG02]